MTANPNLRFSAVLMATVSGLSLATPALAADVLFSSKGDTALSLGERVHQVDGLKQIRLDGGATVSVLDAADYRINADGSVDLYAGSLTVASGAGETIVHMPDGIEGRVGGRGAAANFSVAADGTGRGHAMTGQASIGRAGDMRRFDAGEMFAFAPGKRPERTVANGAQATPGADMPQIASMADGGPAAAAQNGVPVTLGDALAAAGASSDILAAARRVDAAVANPAIESFPSGDLALLVAKAGDVAHAYGGSPFPAAQADIVRTYLSWLAGGGSRAAFLTAYAGFLGDYLDLLRSGAAPSSFGAASLADIEAFLAYSDRSGRLAQLGASDRTLAEAYLAFLRGGGDRDLFTARFVDLTRAYFAFVRGGGDPGDFTQASADTIARYIAFLSESGLAAQLGASDRALLDAYLANGGLAFAGQYRAALDGYYAWLAAGRLPSGYAALDAATLKTYLETLSRSGLLASVAGDRAAFFSAYLDWLRGGGAPDAFAGLPANIFAGYAEALTAYYGYLEKGGVPSAYAALTPVQIRAYLAALDAAGASGRFLDDLADFYSGYFAFVAGGGNPDQYAGLPVPPDYPAFAAALNAYAAFLAGGGLPADYDAQSLATLKTYLDAVAASGQLASLLGNNATLLDAYFAYLAGGGAPNGFGGLPVYADYVSALNAYYAYLANGGLPAAYGALTPAQIRAYLAALNAAGGLAAFADLDGFFAPYYAYLASGGDPARYADLPAYDSYVAALNAYYAYLANGGLPAGYTKLTQEQVAAYLAALNAAGGFAAHGDLDAFFGAYYAFLAGGGNPADYGGLPVYANWLQAVQAYYAYLLGGGAPSGYTALTPEQVETYLAALDRAGVLEDQFSGAALQFLTGYLAYIETGADPDRFAGLPGNGTDPGTNPNYPGGFPSGVTGARAYAAHAGVSAQASGAPQLDANGALTDAGDLANVNAEVADVGGDASVVVGRYTNGTARFRGGTVAIGPNGGLPWVVTAPLAAPLPTTGTIDYEVLAATKPVFASGRAAPGSFDADLTIGFGPSNLSYGFDGTIVMPEDGGDVRYDFASAGRDTGALVSTGSINPVFNMNGTMTGSGDACSSDNCLILFYGGFGGSEERIGMTYQTVDNPNFQRAERIQGTVAFAATGTGGGDPDPDPQYNSVAAPPQFAYAGGFDPASPVVGFITTLTLKGGPVVPGSETGSRATAYDLAANGGLLQYTREGGVTRTNGSTTITDVSGNADMLIGRWTDGVNTGANPFTLSADQGLHYMLVRPVETGFALPAQGLISYDLLAATRPTIVDGSLPAGGFDGDMAIVLGTAPKIAFDATITMPGLLGQSNRTFRYATTGGMADPAQSDTPLTTYSGGLFAFRVSGVAGPDCQTADCQFDAKGAFAGGSEQLGLTYQAGNDLGDAKAVIGAALFGNGTLTGAPPPVTSTGNPANADVLTDMFVTEAGRNETMDLDTSGGNFGFVSYQTDAAGEIVALKQHFNLRLSDGIGSARNADDGQTASGTVRWTRWTEGTLATVRAGPVQPITFSGNQGYHIIVGTPATDLPASGRVDYQLAGGTRPTSVAGIGLPGELTSGAAAVLFGATPKLGIEMAFTQDGASYAMQTAGGLADVGASEISIGATSAFRVIGTYGQGVSVDGAACGGCRPIWEGFLAGTQGREIALTYTMQRQSGDRIIGAAAFTATPPATNPYARAPGSAGIAAAPGGGWDRWTAPAGSPPALVDPATPPAPGVTPIAGASPATLRAEAEALLGGLVSFRSNRP
ncbi:hypothetical protein [Sphingopyxis sp.]|uniref:hypothetical protein n=1 Tax=Sphingopyxis sp. TaxID=1908224 RepID=UPI00260AE470|nr:hypothetical protein [Sphingopyxis sp.]MCW0199594.1 hypothetical protein [Sphingopyxis sp.]